METEKSSLDDIVLVLWRPCGTIILYRAPAIEV